MVFIDGASAGMATVDGSGNWFLTPMVPLANGPRAVRARSSDAAGNTSVDSNTNTFTVDTIEPDTTFTATPPAATNSTGAAFSFTGDGTGSVVASFECSLDGAAFATCTSPQSYTGLAQGSHTFAVRAVDTLGNSDATPAEYTWTVDMVAPTMVLTSAAADPTNAAAIPVTVTFSEPVIGFAAADVVVANGTVTNFAGSGTT